jgi:peptidoglycan/xylan/chitin deacetylase (PgdA/CDA1 family)
LPRLRRWQSLACRRAAAACRPSSGPCRGHDRGAMGYRHWPQTQGRHLEHLSVMAAHRRLHRRLIRVEANLYHAGGAPKYTRCLLVVACLCREWRASVDRGPSEDGPSSARLRRAPAGVNRRSFKGLSHPRRAVACPLSVDYVFVARAVAAVDRSPLGVTLSCKPMAESTARTVEKLGSCVLVLNAR